MECWEGIEQLPTEIGDFYSATLHRIRKQQSKLSALAQQVLVWVIYVKRSLSILELQHALAMNAEAQTLESYCIINEDILVSVCCGLITVDKETQHVRLVREWTSGSLNVFNSC